jgi:hypothetical protein
MIAASPTPSVSPTPTIPKIARFTGVNANVTGPTDPTCAPGPSTSGPVGPPCPKTMTPSTYPNTPAVATAVAYIQSTTRRPVVSSRSLTPAVSTRVSSLLRYRRQSTGMEDKELLMLVLAGVAALMFLTGFVLVLA